MVDFIKIVLMTNHQKFEWINSFFFLIANEIFIIQYKNMHILNDRTRMHKISNPTS